MCWDETSRQFLYCKYCSDVCGIDITRKNTSDRTLQRVRSQVSHYPSLSKWSNFKSIFLRWVVQPPTRKGWWICPLSKCRLLPLPRFVLRLPVTDGEGHDIRRAKNSPQRWLLVVREFLGLVFMPQVLSCFGNATFFLGLWPGQFWIFEFFTSQRRNDCDWLCWTRTLSSAFPTQNWGSSGWFNGWGEWEFREQVGIVPIAACTQQP